MAKGKDLFTQRLVKRCTMSAGADTLVTQLVTDAYRPQDRIGFVIQEVLYHFVKPYIVVMGATGNRIKFGLSFVKDFPIGGPEAIDTGVIDHHAINRQDVVAVAADVMYIEHNPAAYHDFSGLQGGGYLVHPVNLFIFTYPDAALVSSCPIDVEIIYFTIELTEDKFIELWQSIYIPKL